MDRKTIIWSSVVAILILIIILTQTCKQPKNVVIENISTPISQTSQQVHINDSLKAVKQDVLIAQIKSTIMSLQDSLEKQATKAASITPQTVVRYVETSTYKDVIGKYQDSLSSLLDTLISLKNQYSQVEINQYLLTKAIPYKIENKWFRQQGKFDLYGNIVIDSLKIISKPFVILGEKGKWYQRKTITALVGNSNPNIAQEGLQSFTYVPKSPIQLSGGPIILTNGKSTTVGVGLTIKKNIFSLTIGYQFPNIK